MAYSKASQRAVDKYVKENYESYLVRFKKGEKEKIKTHAESLGMSMNAFVVEAINEKMSKA